MPRCFYSLRYAVHSLILRCSPSTTRSWHLQWHNSVRSAPRTYTTVLPERRPDDDQSHEYGVAHGERENAQYLDFILGGREEEDETRQRQTARLPKAGDRVDKALKPTGTKIVRTTEFKRSSVTYVGDRKRTVKNARFEKASGRRRLRPAAARQQPALSTLERARVRARTAAYRAADRNIRVHKQSIRSARRTSAVFSSAWNQRYFTLTRRYDRRLEEHFGEERTFVTFAPAVTEWKDLALGHMKDWKSRVPIEAIARRQNQLGRVIWAEVALWLLCHDKDKLIDFLVATHAPLYPPINWVEGCLQAIARHYTLQESLTLETRQRKMAKLISAFVILSKRETGEQFIFEGSFVRLLLPHATHQQVTELYGAIRLEDIRVAPNTLLHFADHFAKHGFLEQSLDALLEAKKVGADIHSVAFRNGCATVLRKSIQHPAGLRTCLRLIENLVSMGVKLDRTLCNIVMLNAVEAGDVHTMHAVHRSAIEQGFEPSSYTHAIRLKAIKADITNAEELKAVIQDCITSGAVRHNMVLSMEILHCLAMHHVTCNPESAFATVCAAYLQLFDPAPLVRLGLPLASSPRMDSPAGALMPPPPHAIGLLVSMYLLRTPAEETRRTYHRWRELVSAGDMPLAASAATPHLCNIFLKAFCRARDTLLDAAQLVKDMQRPLPETAGVRQAGPDLYTWSIFLDGFARRGEAKLAEQVLSYMRSKVMEPNVVTWNTLIKGYTEAQDVEGAFDVIKKMEASGTAWSDWTNSTLSRIRDKRRLRQLLEEQRLEKALDFSSSLKDDLAQKLSRAGNLVESESHDKVPKSHGKAGFADSSAELAELAAGVTQV